MAYLVIACKSNAFRLELHKRTHMYYTIQDHTWILAGVDIFLHTNTIAHM